MSVQLDKKRGTWIARFDVREGGQRRQSVKRGFASEGEAELWVAKQLVEHEADVSDGVGNLFFRDYAAWWIKHKKGQDLAPRTVQGYESVANLYIIPALGHLRVKSVTARRIESFYEGLRQYEIIRGKGKGEVVRTGLGQTTRHHVHEVLRQMLRKAGFGAVIDQVDSPGVNHGDHDPLTPDALRAVLSEALETPLGPFVVLALHGMGRSEILGLEWPDVHADEGWLRVRQTRQWIAKQGEYIGRGKTDQRRKPLFLAPVACAVLMAMPRAGSYVFAYPDGRPWHYYYPDKLWTKIRPAGLRLYDLRHNYASWLMRLTDPATAAAQLRHNVETMATWYTHTPMDPAHPLLARQREAAAAFGDILRLEDRAGDHAAITEITQR